MLHNLLALFHRTPKAPDLTASCDAEKYQELLKCEKDYLTLQRQFEELHQSFSVLKQQYETIWKQNEFLNEEITRTKKQLCVQKQQEKVTQGIDQLLEQKNLVQLQLAELHGKFNECLYCSDFRQTIAELQDKKLELECQIFRLTDQKEKVEYFYDLESELAELTERRNDLQSELAELNQEKLFQDFALYEPVYKFSTSSLYKDRLKEIRDQQKQMLLKRTAFVCSVNWKVNGSSRLGEKMVRESAQQMLLAFNIECENAISHTTFNNWESMKKRIMRAFRRLNQLNNVNRIQISTEYLDLKLQEFCLAYEYALKKQEEKEFAKQERALARERARVEEELRQEMQRIEKEQQHYKNALRKLEDQFSETVDIEKKKVLSEKIYNVNEIIQKLDVSLADVEYRQANEKAGYVYIISNIGAFGPDVFKIGMTRRLNPQERIDELGGASVPFRFDVHAFIFSDDAPKLEAALHKAFSDKRVNAMNNRKEFFRVSLKEIEQVVKENHDKTVDFCYEFSAQQYRETMQLRHLEKQQTMMNGF